MFFHDETLALPTSTMLIQCRLSMRDLRIFLWNFFHFANVCIFLLKVLAEFQWWFKNKQRENEFKTFFVTFSAEFIQLFYLITAELFENVGPLGLQACETFCSLFYRNVYYLWRWSRSLFREIKTIHNFNNIHLNSSLLS